MGCVCLLSCLSPQEVKQYLCGSKLGTQETSPSQSPKMFKKKKKMPHDCCSFSCFSRQLARYYYCFGTKLAVQETSMEEKDQTQPTRSSKKNRCCLFPPQVHEHCRGSKLATKETQSSQPNKKTTCGCCGLFSPQKVKQYCCMSKLVEQEAYESLSSQPKEISCGCCLLSCFPCMGTRQFFCKSKTATRPTLPSANTTKIEATQLTFRRLATMTKNFRQECLIGEGGFGRVYKGTWDKSGTVVAVKLLDRTLGLQAKEEFLSEVSVLSHLKHKNLVNLVGFCAHGDQRLLVYEYMEMGSLENYLHGVPENKKELNWLTRMKIAYGVAKGLEYLHCDANPGPVIYGNLKSSNVLLDLNLNPKLSDLRVTIREAKQYDQPMNNTIPAMGMLYGYCAPEYQTATMKSDIYSFGVMMLELISGRRAIDLTKMSREQNLVAWAQPMFKDPKSYSELVDPDLHGDFVITELQHAVATAAMCLQEDAEVRPLIADVVHALSFLGDHATDANSHLHDDPHHFNINALKSDVSRSLSISFKFPNTTSFSF